MTYINVVTQIKEALLRLRDVQKQTGLSRSGLYAAVKKGTFPAPIKIGIRAVAWRASQITQWISDKAQGGSK